MRDEHRHLRAVLAGIKNLARLVVVRVERDFGFAKNRARSGFHVGAENRSRNRETGEGVKRFGVRPFSRKASGRPNARQWDFAHKRAVQTENLDLTVSVLQIHAHELIVERAGAAQRFFRFGNDFLPVFALRLGDVDRDDAMARRFQIRAEPEHRPVVVDEGVIRVEIHQQLDDRRVGLLQVLVEDAVFGIGALRGRDDEIMAVIGHGPVEIPILVIGPMINEFVLGLRRPEPMIIEFVEVIGFRQPGLFGRFVVTRVKKSLAIFCPGRARKFHPFDDIGPIFHRSHLTHADFLPIGPGSGKRVSHEIAVLGDVIAFQRHSSVSGKLVRVEQHLRLGVKRGDRVKHALILQPVVPGEEIAASLLERHAVTLVIPQPGQARLDGRQPGNLLKIAESDFVLRLHPGLCLRRIVVLQPAIRIGDLHAVIIVHDVRPARVRVNDFGRRGVVGGLVGHAAGDRQCRRQRREMTNDE